LVEIFPQSIPKAGAQILFLLKRSGGITVKISVMGTGPSRTMRSFPWDSAEKFESIF